MPKVPTVLTHVCATLHLPAKKVPIPWVYQDLAVRLLYIHRDRERIEASRSFLPHRPFVRGGGQAFLVPESRLRVGPLVQQ